MKKRRTFRGGYRFGKLEGSPKPELKESEIPGEVIILLRQGFGEEVPPIVKLGDKVKAGQIIGIEDSTCSSPIHATVNGTVKDIRAINRFGQETGAVFIESDGSRGWSRMSPASTDYTNFSPDEIGKAIYISGVASLGRAGFPTRYNTSHLQPDEVESLIINAVNSEPFALSNEVLLAGNLSKFISGIDILRRALPGDVEVYVGVDERDKKIIAEIEKKTNWLHVYPLKPKYPQDHDVVLAQTILGKCRRDTCAPGSPYRCIVLDAQAVLHAYEAMVEGKPVIERIVALGGSGLSESLHLKVRIGTPLEYIIAPRTRHSENRCIYGGIMTGVACDDLSLPIDRTVSSIAVLEENRERQFLSFLRPGIHRDSFSNAFLSSPFPMVNRRIDTNINGEHRPCIYCNYCEEVCPVGLMPYLLSQYITHDMVEEAGRYRIQACIDCGLCTYVCPSKIPLMTHIQEGKEG